METIYERIKKRRIQLGMTVEDLANKMGYKDKSSISKIENGTRNPSLNLLKRLADGMGMTLKIEFIPKK